MKVWIDQDLCTGDGLCEEIAPDVFTLLDDGLAYVVEGDKIFAEAKGNPQGADGLAEFPDSQLAAVVESAAECPGECIYLEPCVAPCADPNADRPRPRAGACRVRPHDRARGRPAESEVGPRATCTSVT